MGLGNSTLRWLAVSAVVAVLGLLAPVVMVGGASAAAVDPIVNVAPPVITGTAQVGERVRTSSGATLIAWRAMSAILVQLRPGS